MSGSVERAGPGRRLVIHVGASKSGTSAFQAAVRRSTTQLRAAGYAVPFLERQDYTTALLGPFGWEAGSGFVRMPSAGPLARFRDALQRVPRGGSVLMSSEDLAELESDAATAIVTAAQELGFDVHVVVTARDWGKQLPSEWQQFLKHRMTEEFETFLGSVRDRSSFYGRHFRQRQDFADICDRWGQTLPADRVHVVVVPTRREDPYGLFSLMAETLGIPVEALVAPTTDVNRSYGIVEAELYRRLNTELAKLRPNRRRRTFQPIREILSRGALRRNASPRLKLPPEHLAWVLAESEDIVQRIRVRGYRVHGDLARLLPDVADTAPTPTVSDADIARVAVETFARFAVNSVLKQHRTLRGGTQYRRSARSTASARLRQLLRRLGDLLRRRPRPRRSVSSPRRVRQERRWTVPSARVVRGVTP